MIPGNYRDVREYTCRLIDLMEDGMIDPHVVAEMALSWMSEDDVKAMCLANDLCQDDEDEDE